jgi:tetratricopeptide (TPR) repeat protein
MIMASEKSCFLVMPIRKAGTEEYDHFRALRDTVLEPVLDQLGYKVTRADDITKSGAVTAEILRQLAEADLVVADLTDLNPNVFYELGIRHTLRGQGTIMIVDTNRTAVPFDLSPYRVIEFAPDLRGIEKLRDLLSRFAGAIAGDIIDATKDNPVHDYLRSLPDNIYAHVEGSSEGTLRQEIAQLREKLRSYSERFGADLPVSSSETAINTIAAALMKAKRGELPVDLFYRAHVGARQENRIEFLESLHQLMTGKTSEISSENWSTLASDALALQLEDVALVLYDQAIELRPNDQSIKRYQLSALAHSDDPGRRAKGRAELASLLGITFNDQEISVGSFPAERLSTVGVMLDAYHNDDLHEEALRLTTVLAETYPDNAIALRNHARALELTDHVAESDEFYGKAMQASDADDTTANWYASKLLSDHRTADAVVMYLRAGLLDPDDARHFMSGANTLGYGLVTQATSSGRNGREFPKDADASWVVSLVIAAYSCPTFSADLHEKSREVLQRIEMDTGLREQLADLRRGEEVDGDIQLYTRTERIQLLHTLLSQFSDRLTDTS